MLSQHLKVISEVIHMLGHYLTFHHHIINIDLNILAKLGFKHFSHHSLVSRPCILQSKMHHHIMTIPSGRYKSSLLLVGQSQWYLMVPLKGIHKTHLRMTSCRLQ